MIALYQDPKGNKVMLSHQADSNASLALSGGINPTEEVEVLKRKIIQQKHEQAILKERIALLEASSNGVCSYIPVHIEVLDSVYIRIIMFFPDALRCPVDQPAGRLINGTAGRSTGWLDGQLINWPQWATSRLCITITARSDSCEYNTAPPYGI